MTPLTLQLLLQVEERQHVPPCRGRHHLETQTMRRLSFKMSGSYLPMRQEYETYMLSFVKIVSVTQLIVYLGIEYFTNEISPRLNHLLKVKVINWILVYYKQSVVKMSGCKEKESSPPNLTTAQNVVTKTDHILQQLQDSMEISKI